jgi:hypothetical protein
MDKRSILKIGTAVGLFLVILTTVSVESTFAHPRLDTDKQEQRTDHDIGLRILEPLDTSDPDRTSTLGPAGPLSLFFQYFNPAITWFFAIGAGFAILNTLVAGVQIIFVADNPSRRADAVQRIIWSISGLLILAFAGMIMRFLNSVGYS